MIDTIFFLLVYFMVQALSMVQMSAHKVELPQSATATQKPAEKVVLTISKDGDYFIDEQQVSEADIRPLLTQKINDRPDVNVVINCDRNQHGDKFLKVFDLVKQANAQVVMFATAPKDNGKEAP
ncbi:MAG: biopolymer transporter ExbD [Armatimonadota bacterium]|nr:biopolymer transporter ExbD [Armatimonadota bacterium]